MSIAEKHQAVFENLYKKYSRTPICFDHIKDGDSVRLLSYLCHFYEFLLRGGKAQNGWFYCARERLEDMFLWNYQKQHRVLTKLSRDGWIRIRINSRDSTRYICVNMDKVQEARDAYDAFLEEQGSLTRRGKNNKKWSDGYPEFGGKETVNLPEDKNDTDWGEESDSYPEEDDSDWGKETLHMGQIGDTSATITDVSDVSRPHHTSVTDSSQMCDDHMTDVSQIIDKKRDKKEKQEVNRAVLTNDTTHFKESENLRSVTLFESAPEEKQQASRNKYKPIPNEGNKTSLRLGKQIAQKLRDTSSQRNLPGAKTIAGELRRIAARGIISKAAIEEAVAWGIEHYGEQYCATIHNNNDIIRAVEGWANMRRHSGPSDRMLELAAKYAKKHQAPKPKKSIKIQDAEPVMEVPSELDEAISKNLI